MGKKTPLYEAHQQAGAKLVDFAGWDMPLHYGSQLEEHQKVRQSAGVFDVSHMVVVDIIGVDAQPYLRYLLANDVARLEKPGKALYSCMLNSHGGVIDDLIVYYMKPKHYRLVVNAGTGEKDLAWMRKHQNNFAIQITSRPEFAILAIQGPHAREKAQQAFHPAQARLAASLEPFHFVEDENWMIARTGYTGEDGFEVILPAREVVEFWQRLLATGIHSCGLGARDTLRLEAGLNLYGSDMDETTTPLESNLAWTIAWEPATREFIGRAALETQKQAGVKRRLVGLALEERGVLRAHQKVSTTMTDESGEITSGTFSPTLGHAVALARIPANVGTSCMVEIRGKLVSVRVVKPPFVKHGKKVFV